MPPTPVARLPKLLGLALFWGVLSSASSAANVSSVQDEWGLPPDTWRVEPKGAATHGRRVQTQTYASVEIESDPGTNQPVSVTLLQGTDVALPVSAGVPYLTVKLDATSTPTGTSHFLALVPFWMTSAQASAGLCATAAMLDVTGALKGTISGISGSVSGTTITWELTTGDEHQYSVSHRRRTAFRAAGNYRLCYTNTGSWYTGAVLVPSSVSNIVVYGAVGFEGVPLMRNKKHFCFSGARPGTNCKVLLEGVIGSSTGDEDFTVTNRMTWSLRQAFEHTCGLGLALPTLGNGIPAAPFIQGGQAAAQSGMVFDLGYTTALRSNAHFWLCYCPGFNADNVGLSCSSAEDFLQVVGQLIMFYVEQAVATIVPITKFSLTVRCGSVAGCEERADNRIKVLEPTSYDAQWNENNLPIWDSQSGCRIYAQSSHYLSPPNCVGVTECSALVNGGEHIDFKKFKNIMMANTVMIGVGITEAREFDLCYCDIDCLDDENWFKVGAFEVKAVQVSFDAPPTSVGTLQVVNTPGLLRLATPPSDFEDGVGGITNSMGTGAQVKLLSDDDLGITDALCASEVPDLGKWTNHGCTVPWECFPRGMVNTTTQIMTLNGKYLYGGLTGAAFQDDPLVPDLELAVMASHPGMYAVCYCEQECDMVSRWARLTRLEVRGPRPSQHWYYQTLIPFDLTVRGWGLNESNRVKIITSDFTCDDDFGGAAGNWERLHIRNFYYPFFDAELLRHDSSVWSSEGDVGARNPIVGIADFFAQGSLLRFARNPHSFGSVEVLTEGDVLVISNLSVDYSGEYPYLYPASAFHESIISLAWGHRLTTQVEDEAGTSFVIPPALKHEDGSIPTWSGSLQATWVRTSEQVYSQIESTEARNGLRVCWSDGDSSDAFIAEAGTLDLEDAPLMQFSTASLMTTAEGALTPLVISFGTSVASSERYLAAQNSMTLRIYVQDPYIEVLAADLTGSELPFDAQHSELGLEDQFICGKLFREMWSGHVNGFPVPKGCYYNQLDKSYVVVFGPRNGLAGSSEYQIVMNVRVSEPSGLIYWETNPVIRLWSLDDIIERREFAVEVGACYLRQDRLPRASAQGAEAQVAAGGFQIISRGNGTQRGGAIVDLSLEPDLSVLTFLLHGQQGAPIQAGHQLRVFFFPLTIWHLDIDRCEVACTHLAEDGFCGSNFPTDHAVCHVDAVVGVDAAPRRDVVRVVLPPTMAPASEEADAGLRIELPGLRLPTGGLFPSLFALEVTGEGGVQHPDLAYSSGLLVYVPPKLLFGAIVGLPAGDGNEKPFREDTLNTLYVRLMFGASLRSQPPSSVMNRTASLVVEMPDGYACRDTVAVPRSLTVFEGGTPSGNGQLPPASASAGDPDALGQWVFMPQGSNICRLDFRTWSAIFAGSSVFLGLVVDNPHFVLPIADERNRWYVSLESFGDDTSNATVPYQPPPRPFHGDAQSFGHNVAVQGKLASTIAPIISTFGSTSNRLYVFIMTEQGAGQRAQVRITGPEAHPYDFGRLCSPGFLEANYYVDIPMERSTYPLPGMDRQIECRGIRSTVEPSRYYGALLQLSGRLRGGRQYGFSLLVRNPSVYNATDAQGWNIETFTESDDAVDATHTTISMNPREEPPTSFGLYAQQPSSLDLQTSFILSLTSRLPNSVTGTTAWLALGGITFSEDTICDLRVVAPGLYVFSYLNREFLYRPNEVLPLLPSQGLLSDGSPLVDEVLPVGVLRVPVIEPLNVIASDFAATFRAGAHYGLAAKVLVPDRPNTASIDSFYVQCGASASESSDRPFSVRLDAPPMAVLTDSRVTYSNNIVSAQNDLRFRVRTTEPIEATGALVIQGPAGFASLAQCSTGAVGYRLDERLQELRDILLVYETLVLQLNAVTDSGDTESEVFLSLLTQVSQQQQLLTSETAALILDFYDVKALPWDTGCRFTTASAVQPYIEITLQVGKPNQDVDARLIAFARQYTPEALVNTWGTDATLLAGLFEFEIIAINPDHVVTNHPVEEAAGEDPGGGGQGVAEVGPTGCGFEQCWAMSAYMAPFSDQEPSDKAALFSGFKISLPMAEAFFADLTPEQREAVDRSDRPSDQNQLVFVLNLSSSVEAVPGGTLRQDVTVRAPDGFLFPEDCRVATSQDTVFGALELWPEHLNLSLWTASTGDVVSCEGLENIAYFTVLGSEGMLPEHRYAFRIDVLANPEVTPFRNYWAVEVYSHYDGNEHSASHAESSEPFLGFGLWTFSNVQLVPGTTERSDGFDGTVTQNELTLIFRAQNEIPAVGGAIRLRAPTVFEWLPGMAVAENASLGAGGFVCAGELREKPAETSAAMASAMAAGSLGTSFWNKIPADCFIDQLFKNEILLRLTGEQPIRAHVDAALIATVANPALEIQIPGVFQLRSWQPLPGVTYTGVGALQEGMTVLDIAEIPGFPVTKGLEALSIVPVDSTEAAKGASTAAASVLVEFVEAVFPLDVIKLTAPPGYMLRSPEAALSDGAASEECLGVLNRAKPGAFYNQALRCFSGIFCVLDVEGRDLREDSYVQLHLPDADHACGNLPGRGIDIRRSKAGGESPGTQEIGGMAMSRSYNLGFNLSSAVYRVCYCHGDGGCTSHRDFCQEVGNLTITDLCEGLDCPAAEGPCLTRCDPRLGRCVLESRSSLALPDGVSCTPLNSSSSTEGFCEGGVCLDAALRPTAPPTPTPTLAEEIIVSSETPASCIFDVFQCDNRSLTWTVGHGGFERLYQILFEVMMLHPEEEPPEDNNFVLAHDRGGIVRGSRVIGAYNIQPQFRSISASVVGQYKAGGASTSVELRATAVSAATSLILRIKEPIGLDFSASTVSQPVGSTVLEIIDDTIEVAMQIEASMQVVLLIDNVLFPRHGGQTLIDVVSYNGTEIKDTALSIPSFGIPAFIDVSEVLLQNEYKLDETGMFSAEASFGNRLGEWAWLTLRLWLSATAAGPPRLRMTASSWRFAPQSASMQEQLTTGEPTPIGSLSLRPPDSLDADGAASELELSLSVDMLSAEFATYLLEVEVLAPEDIHCACWNSGACELCKSQWTVEVIGTQGNTLASNDGLLVGFPLVSELSWEIFTPHAPPYADLSLNLRLIRVGAVPATVLIFTAPIGYEFPYSCFPGNGTSFSEVVSGPRFDRCTGRLNTATITLDDSGLFRSTTLTLIVRTSREAPADNRWYLEGRTLAENKQVAWGVAGGIDTETLDAVSVLYGTFETLSTLFVLTFMTEVDIKGGGYIIVEPPAGYILSCAEYHIYFMPGDSQGEDRCSETRTAVRMRFTDGLVQLIEYSFAVLGKLPYASTSDSSAFTWYNTSSSVDSGDFGSFTVQAADLAGTLLEASFEVPAMAVRSYGGIQTPSLLWYDSPQPDATIWATVVIRVPQRAPAGLRQLQVELPQGFGHGVMVSSKSPNRYGVTLVWQGIEMPRAVPGTFSDYLSWVDKDAAAAVARSAMRENVSGSRIPGEPPLIQDDTRWLDLGRQRVVGVNFDPTVPLPSTEMAVRFPVRLPGQMPSLNFWQVAFVFDDGGPAARFVLNGFMFNEPSPAHLVEPLRHMFLRHGREYYEYSGEFVNVGHFIAYPGLPLLFVNLLATGFTI